MSFQKRTPNSGNKAAAKKFPEIPGTKISTSTGFQLFTSTGIPDLDSVALESGGIPIGSVLLVRDEDASLDKEDRLSDAPQYGKLVQKYFLAEGLCHGHDVFYASLDENGEKFIKNLPEISENENNDHAGPAAVNDEQMKIAWRYQNQPKTTKSSKDISKFNLHKQIQCDILDKASKTIWNEEGDGKGGSYYKSVIRKLKETLENESRYGVAIQSDRKPNILRVCLDNFGSLLWSSNPTNDLPPFLLALRSLLRSHLAVALITLPSSADFEHYGGALARLNECVDFAVDLKTFDTALRSSPSMAAFKDWHGFLETKKFASFNVFVPKQIPSKFLFKSTKTRFKIERIHLPPDLGGAEPTPQEKSKLNSKSIDF